MGLLNITWMACNNISPILSGVWGVDENNDVYHYFRSAKWKHIPGIKMMQIDSGPEGIVVGVTENHEVYHRTGISNTNYVGKEWVKIDGSLTHVSCGRSGCWGVDSAEHVYYIDGVFTRSCLAAGLVAVDGRMKQVDVGVLADVYAINKHGNLYVRLGVTKTNAFGTEWKFLRQASYVTSGWTGQYVLVDNVVYESSGNYFF